MYLFGFAVTVELFKVWPKLRESQISGDFLLSVPTSSLCRKNVWVALPPQFWPSRSDCRRFQKTTGLRNTQKKYVRDEDKLLFSRELFFNVVFGRLRTNCEVVFLFFLSEMGKAIRFQLGTRPGPYHKKPNIYSNSNESVYKGADRWRLILKNWPCPKTVAPTLLFITSLMILRFLLDSITCLPESAATHVIQTTALSLWFRPYFKYTRCEVNTTNQLATTTWRMLVIPQLLDWE